jgi:hypothetical protein
MGWWIESDEAAGEVEIGPAIAASSLTGYFNKQQRMTKKYIMPHLLSLTLIS